MTLSDIIEIQQLMSLYGHVVDGDLTLLDQVFTDDAVFDVRLTGWGLLEGLEAIRAWFALGKPPHPPSHHQTNVHVYKAEGKVHVRSKWIFISRKTDTLVSGDYNDIVVPTPLGWRIAHRSLLIRYPENYQPSSSTPTANQDDNEQGAVSA